jgi:protein-arginine kinase activator protein McsA
LQLKVQNEEFEEAALLRDRIKSIEAKIVKAEKEKGETA